jgi:UDP-GlcNAc:undecaprenyl-phosphate GlcNAc-1-phosphate transferase
MSVSVGQWLPQLGMPALAGGTAFAVAFALTPLVRLAAVRRGLVGRPTEARWGRRLTARLGGVAMLLGFLAATLAWVAPSAPVVALLIGTVLAGALGLLDDVRGLPPYTKLVGQLIVGCIVVLGGIRLEAIPWLWLSIPVSVLWFVFVMNAMNLLDNMDGLAAGIGALAAASCLAHGVVTGQGLVVSLAAVVLGACLGFLQFNFPPAKIYMGDVGSHFLGLSLATLAILGNRAPSTHLLGVLAVPVLLLAVPIFDTCFVTVQRLVHRQHPFVGGRDHVSHRLAILGLSTRQTVLALYGVSAVVGLLSLVSASWQPLPTLALGAAVLTALLVFGMYLTKVNVYREARGPLPAPVSPRKPVTLIETMLLHKRRLVEVLVDFGILSSAYVVAYLLRFEGQLTADLQQLIAQSLPVLLVVKLGCFAGCGLYRGVWRYMSLADLTRIFRASVLGSVLSSLALLFLWRFEGYSRAVLVIDWTLSFLGVAGSRVVERLLDEWIVSAQPADRPVVLIGAGDTGERVLRYLRYEHTPRRRVVGFLDDDRLKHGSHIRGVPVLGDRSRLAALLRQHDVREVLVAIADPPGELLEHVRRTCEPLGVGWKVVTAGVTDAVG